MRTGNCEPKIFPAKWAFSTYIALDSCLKNTQKDMTINYILQLTCISMKYDPSQSITSENKFIVLIIFTSQELFLYDYSNKSPL